jgi:tellurite resistance protein
VLAGLAMLPHFPKIASACCAVGTVGTIAFSVRRQGGLWQGGRELEAITPVLLLPTVAGHFVVATAAGTLGWHGWGGLFLGVGCLTWLALESVILHRLLVGEALTPAQRPTLGISMAPPVVGLVAYLAMGGSADLVARLLLGYGLMQGLILLRLLPWIRDQEFGAGYWAFTFGATALALGAEQMVQLGGSGPELVLAPVLFVAVNVAVGTIALGSLVRLYQGRLLPAPAVTAAPQRECGLAHRSARRCTMGYSHGVVTIVSRLDFDDLLHRLRTAIAERKLTLFLDLDQQQAAVADGATMPRGQLLLFGRPRAGTEILVAVPEAGVDLPLKLYVWEGSDGTVSVSYTDPAFLAARHHLPDRLVTPLRAITAVVEEAVGAPGLPEE